MIPLTVAVTFIAVFLLVLSIFLGITTVLALPSAVLKKRLKAMTEPPDSHTVQDEEIDKIIVEISPFKQLLARFPLLMALESRLERILDHAGLTISATRFTLYALLVMAPGFCVAYLLTESLGYSCTAMIVLMLALTIIVKQLEKQRLKKFTGQLPEVLSMISRSLRAGHSMTSAIELVGTEVADPAGELFRIAFEQQKLGVRTIDTLNSMAHRFESLDLRFFITAVSINSEVGGNLAEVLDKLAETIRERLKIRHKVSVITAQGRLSGYVLGVLPLVAFLGMTVLMPGYEEELLREKQGQQMLIGAMGLQVIGFFVIRKIINIRI
jgi:tight adherence protein B